MKYSKEDIVPVHAKLRFSTLIVLPEDEEILDFTTGDKEFWVINGAHNLCYVHPAQAGIRSNLNLITASGHVYSFLLTEISNEPNAEPDLKLFVEPKEGSGIAANSGLRGYVSAGEAEAYKKELETLRSQTAEQIHAAQAQSAEQVNHFRSSYATKLQFDYPPRPESGAASHSWFPPSTTTTSFTYIKCAAREKPALYEIKDGKPNLISFQVENGVYIAPKIIDTGYLAIGKKKLPFARRVRRTEGEMNQPTQPAQVQEKAPKPQGLLPKNVQSWLLIGVAFLMVAIMWLTGGKKPQTPAKGSVLRRARAGAPRSQRIQNRRDAEPHSGFAAPATSSPRPHSRSRPARSESPRMIRQQPQQPGAAGKQLSSARKKTRSRPNGSGVPTSRCSPQMSL